MDCRVSSFSIKLCKICYAIVLVLASIYSVLALIQSIGLFSSNIGIIKEIPGYCSTDYCYEQSKPLINKRDSEELKEELIKLNKKREEEFNILGNDQYDEIKSIQDLEQNEDKKLTKTKNDKKKKITKPQTTISGIPKIMHFIKVDYKPLDLAEYLAIKSAWIRIRPDLIYLHYIDKPPSGEWANKLSSIVKFNKVAMPFIRNDTAPLMVQHISDFIRVEVLIKYGGIYYDTDLISLREIDELLQGQHTVVLARTHKKFIMNTVMMCQKNAKFMKVYLMKAREAFDNKRWSKHGVLALGKLYEKWKPKESILLLPVEVYSPTDWSKEGITQLFTATNLDFSKAYGIHIHASKAKNYKWYPFTQHWIAISNSTFAKTLQEVLSADL